MGKEIKNSFYLQVAMRLSVNNATAMRNPYFTPEHLLDAIIVQKPTIEALREMGIDYGDMLSPLREYTKQLEHVPEELDYTIEPSHQFQQLIMGAVEIMRSSSAKELEITHIIRAAMYLSDSLAANVLNTFAGKVSDFLSTLIWKIEEFTSQFPIKGSDLADKGVMSVLKMVRRAMFRLLRATTFHSMTTMTWMIGETVLRSRWDLTHSR